MELRTLYQTLKFKDNNDEVIAHGPYYCSDDDAWLHEGYYFWEKFIDPAHHWGKNRLRVSYIITQGECILFHEDIFDLLGNLDHVQQLNEVIDFLESEKIYDVTPTVRHVIDFLQKEETFHFLASRADTTDSFGHKYDLDKLTWDPKNPAFFVKNPAVQICIYDLEKCMFGNFNIVEQVLLDTQNK